MSKLTNAIQRQILFTAYTSSSFGLRRSFRMSNLYRQQVMMKLTTTLVFVVLSLPSLLLASVSRSEGIKELYVATFFTFAMLMNYGINVVYGLKNSNLREVLVQLPMSREQVNMALLTSVLRMFDVPFGAVLLLPTLIEFLLTGPSLFTLQAFLQSIFFLSLAVTLSFFLGTRVGSLGVVRTLVAVVLFLSAFLIPEFTLSSSSLSPFLLPVAPFLFSEGFPLSLLYAALLVYLAYRSVNGFYEVQRVKSSMSETRLRKRSLLVALIKKEMIGAVKVPQASGILAAPVLGLLSVFVLERGFSVYGIYYGISLFTFVPGLTVFTDVKGLPLMVSVNDGLRKLFAGKIVFITLVYMVFALASLAASQVLELEFAPFYVASSALLLFTSIRSLLSGKGILFMRPFDFILRYLPLVVADFVVLYLIYAFGLSIVVASLVLAIAILWLILRSRSLSLLYI
ncbi:hypothetical protein HS1genome_2247 [Sulfodiicoccus acidiphilus]|uniref:Uncharacterized protein n=1 Tax=Sulfodiicoccus acidiphilus TaxID=1670455 RepID=A0A348B6Q6_9CREN|nr:hypothetical protein [Sulfodiicoccus acidiphilus]BBD73858.1 hypothetical protein HS1genome_2247 [Sulfodiicoccus acidiphilus]GGT96282.1 hypothetical protein GCM10007116_12290 [Sulfodiicoccus acidiphilus]